MNPKRFLLSALLALALVGGGRHALAQSEEDKRMQQMTITCDEVTGKCDTVNVQFDGGEGGGALNKKGGSNVIASAPSAPPGFTATTTTFSNTTPTAIPDVTTVTSTITVSGVGAYLLDLDMTTFITHNFPADLDITLTSPAGTIVTITTDNGGGRDNVFNGTLWDDDANPGGAVPYTTNDGLVTDHNYVNLTLASPLVPEEAMGAFIGEDPNGTWTITVFDDFSGDAGTLSSWSLDVTTLPSAPATTSNSFTNTTPVSFPAFPATTVTSTLTVSGCDPYLLDLNLTTFLTHTFSEDLNITLTSPAGTVVTLTTDNGGGNDNNFNGTLWDDDADPDGLVPYSSNDGLVTDGVYANLVAETSLVPEEAMAAFIGEDPNGTWTITISDDQDGDGGTLSSWTLDITAVPAGKTFVLLANKVTLKRTKQNTPAGDIHSNGTLTVEKGDPSTYNSNLTAVGKITIQKDNTINGDVTSAASISNSGTINGTPSVGPVDTEDLPSLSYSAGGSNKTVPSGGSLSVAPGSYGIVTLNSSGTLKLTSGEYFMNELRYPGSEAVIEIDLSSGDPITINVVSNLQLGKEAAIQLLPNGESDSELVTFNTLQSTAVSFGKEAYLLGSFNAPNAVVTLVKNSQLHGSICAKEILVERDCLFLHHDSPGSLPGPGNLPKSSFDEEEVTSEQSSVISDYALEQNYPNPFNPSTVISFQLPVASEVSLSIFNTNGQLVKQVANGKYASGRHQIVWDATDDRGERVASGVYVYLLKAGPSTGSGHGSGHGSGQAFTAQKKLVLMK